MAKAIDTDWPWQVLSHQWLLTPIGGSNKQLLTPISGSTKPPVTGSQFAGPLGFPYSFNLMFSRTQTAADDPKVKYIIMYHISTEKILYHLDI